MLESLNLSPLAWIVVFGSATGTPAAPIATRSAAHPSLEATRNDETDFDFESLSNEYLAEHELTGLVSGFSGALDSAAFLRVELGSFDIRFPADALGDDGAVDELREAAQAFVDLQRAWFDWRAADPPGEQIEEDWKTLSKWIKSWTASRMRRCEGGDASLYEQLGAKDKVLSAQSRLRELTRPPKETIEAVGDLNVIVIAPTRKHFLQFAAVAGQLEKGQRKDLWQDDVLKHTLAWVGWTQITATRESVFPVDRTRPFAGKRMNDRDKTGLAQYMTDRGAALLLRKEFFRHGTHFFEETLGTNLVIASVGKNGLRSGEWKLEYKTSGSKTEAYERFVPGAASDGTLPKRLAGPGIMTGSAVEISRYRSNDGVEFFVDPLRTGQKLGAKRAFKDKEHPLRLDKIAHFELYSFEANEAGFVSAPFLGTAAIDKELPPLQFLDDYEDFFRAYRSAFVHWLQTRAAGSEADSGKLFAQLIERHATRKLGAPLDEIIEELYRVPMSADDGTTDSLEWRFLAFLKKGR